LPCPESPGRENGARAEDAGASAPRISLTTFRGLCTRNTGEMIGADY
jgi:hypothetical protein